MENNLHLSLFPRENDHLWTSQFCFALAFHFFPGQQQRGNTGRNTTISHGQNADRLSLYSLQSCCCCCLLCFVSMQWLLFSSQTRCSPGKVLVLCWKPAEAAAALRVLEEHLVPELLLRLCSQSEGAEEKNPMATGKISGAFPLVQMHIFVSLKQALLVFLGGFADCSGWEACGDETVVLRTSPAALSSQGKHYLFLLQTTLVRL